CICRYINGKRRIVQTSAALQRSKVPETHVAETKAHVVFPGDFLEVCVELIRSIGVGQLIIKEACTRNIRSGKSLPRRQKPYCRIYSQVRRQSRSKGLSGRKV